MVNWKEAHSKPYKTSDVELFAKLIKNWISLDRFKKNSVLDVWNGSEYAFAAWKLNCKVCYMLQLDSHPKC